MSSGGTRESAQESTIAAGRCPFASSSRRSTLIDTGFEALRAKRSLPALSMPSACRAVSGGTAGSGPAAATAVVRSRTRTTIERIRAVMGTPGTTGLGRKNRPAQRALELALPAHLPTCLPAYISGAGLDGGSTVFHPHFELVPAARLDALWGVAEKVPVAEFLEDRHETA